MQYQPEEIAGTVIGGEIELGLQRLERIRRTAEHRAFHALDIDLDVGRSAVDQVDRRDGDVDAAVRVQRRHPAAAFGDAHHALAVGDTGMDRLGIMDIGDMRAELLVILRIRLDGGDARIAVRVMQELVDRIAAVRAEVEAAFVLQMQDVMKRLVLIAFDRVEIRQSAGIEEVQRAFENGF